MSEETIEYGVKKVVYKDGSKTRVIVGDVRMFVSTGVIEITNENGTMLLYPSATLMVKNAPIDE